MRRHLPAARARIFAAAYSSEEHGERRDAELQAQRAIAVVGKKPVVTRPEREAGGHLNGFVTGAADLEKNLALLFELDLFVVQLARQQHAPMHLQQRLSIEAVEGRAGRDASRLAAVGDGRLHSRKL